MNQFTEAISKFHLAEKELIDTFQQECQLLIVRNKELEDRVKKLEERLEDYIDAFRYAESKIKRLESIPTPPAPPVQPKQKNRIRVGRSDHAIIVCRLEELKSHIPPNVYYLSIDELIMLVNLCDSENIYSC